MAKARKNDKVRARMGVAVEVGNASPKRLAAKKYVAVWVEDEDGSEGGERCLLFTEAQFASLRRLRLPSCFSESSMKPGRLYSVASATTYPRINVSKYRELSPIVLIEKDGAKAVRQIPRHLLAIAERTAAENPEDVPQRSVLSDFLD